jgi:hypothetical protein
LPASWLADLEEATVRADLGLILALIDEIREQSPALADGLARLAQDFEYQKLREWIVRLGGER